MKKALDIIIKNVIHLKLLLKKLFNKKEETIYLIYYKADIKEKIFRNGLSTNSNYLYIKKIFEKYNTKINYYQVEKINNEFYIFFSNKEPINKDLYCMMIYVLLGIKDNNYTKAEELYNLEIKEIDNLKIKIYKK